MPRRIQPSFSRGEIGPDLYGRVDVAGYAVGLRTSENMFSHSQGGASNRAGTLFIGPCSRHAGTPPRLMAFKFNSTDTYMLEFGDELIRFIRGNAHVLNAAVSISGATQADPCVLTAAAHGFSDGDDVYVTGVVGMEELNNRWFTVANSTTNTLELVDQATGADIDATAYTAYSSGGSVSSVFQITSPYSIEDVLDLKYAQSGNVLTLAHASYPVHTLTRTGSHTDWTLAEVTFAPAQDHPTDLSVSNTTGTGTDYEYAVTATNAETQEESIPGLNTTDLTITAATQADPVVVTSNAHGLSNGDEIEINDVVGMTELNGRRFEVSGVTTNTFNLASEDGTAHTAYVSGGVANRTSFTVASGATPSTVVTWAEVEGAGKYSVFRRVNGLYGWIGDTEQLTFTDENIEADLSITPPKARNPFFSAGNYPGVVTYYEQRKVFARTNNKPDTLYYSVVGSENNFSVSSPRQADDAMTVTLNSAQVNRVQSLVAGNDLLAMTTGAEWKISAGQEAAFSAETLRQKPQTKWGASSLDPIEVGEVILFMSDNLRYVRSLGYEITTDTYSGNDMTVFSPHLFKFYSAVDWCYAQWPDPSIYSVREDGELVVLIFNPEQEVTAWSRWQTDGKFLRVAGMRPSDGPVDTLPYFVVSRTIGGVPVYYIERLQERRFKDVRDAFFVDCGLTLDAPLTITAISAADPVQVTSASHGLSDGDFVDVYDVEWVASYDSYYNETQPDQLNGRRYRVAGAATDTLYLVTNDDEVDITGATQANPVVVTSVGHGLSDGEVIGVFGVSGMTELNGNVYKVANKTDDTFELTTLVDADVDGTGYGAYLGGGKAFPAEDGSAFAAYVAGGTLRKAVTTISNLWHLEGAAVVGLADGNVVDGMTVEDGTVTLPSRASRVHLGLRYVSTLETLNPESPSGTVQGKRMRTPQIVLRMQDSRGLLAGPDTTHLTEMKQRQFERMGEPTQLLTGDKAMAITASWASEGRVVVRQIYPLPITVLALVSELDVGDEDEA